MTSLLVENALVIAMTREGDVVPNGALLADGGAIVALHDEARKRAGEITTAGRPLERLDATGFWLLPGFVQTHVHLCQTLLRNGPDDLPLLPWLRQHVFPGEAALDEETMDVSARLGLAELIAGGTTSLLDMGSVRHTEAIFRAAAASGARVTSGNALMDDPAVNSPALRTTTREGLDETGRLAAHWHGAGGGRLRVAYSPRFALSCTEEGLRGAAARAREGGFLLQTHAAENREEARLVRERTGRSNLRYLHETGFSGPDVVLAHVVHADEDDRALLAARGTNIAHCPSSNLKLGSGICPAADYLARGIRVTLGADGAPCNDRLDPFAEMRLAAQLSRVSPGSPPLSAWEVVRMATADGAKALGLERTGTIEAGHFADFVLLDPESGFAAPTSWRGDPYGPIVWSFDRSHVAATYADGRALFRRAAPSSAATLRPSAAEVSAAVEKLAARCHL
ncbi:MAG TPA: amidohydrolase family protein [Thermoanaerobaculia bacterium]|nr:amidohydrolase family protein [Thermoanaerobaculia bacterium]